uniref:Arf-GAP domain-containing protein n=1 Tax=Clytia hemisphaerica TaxID=252671 RepID=A0A7M5XKD9_9CNID
MSSRADKAAKGQKDKHHAILRELVQEPTNKTCAECLAKGPRWSSWSLGVFVCIRCAGIHRNLGVHISKMKSIDLDSWTPEQLQNVLRWGNKRAAEYYECYLPKDFTRPQATHALEAFIRNKYEKKLYIKKDGEPPENPQSKVDRLKNDSREDKEKEKKTTSTASRQRRAEKKVDLSK